MTTITENSALVQQETEIELYEFSQGTEKERYTSFVRGFTFQGNYYRPATIVRGELKQDVKMNTVSLSMTAPYTEWMSRFVPGQPVEPISVVVYRTTASSPLSYEIFFTGDATGVQIEDLTVTMAFEASSKVLRKKIPPYVYQSFCNNDLFDENCGLSVLDYKITATVTSIQDDGNTLIISTPEALDIDWLKGGVIIFNDNMRLITSHEEPSTITVHVPFDSRLSAGSEIELLPGCDGDPATCVNKFDNLIGGFFGMPYIPNSNPVIWGFK